MSFIFAIELAFLFFAIFFFLEFIWFFFIVFLLLGRGGWERSNTEAPEIQHDHCIQNSCLISHSLASSEDNRFPDKEGSCILISEILTSNIFNSAFGNLRSVAPPASMEWLSRHGQNYTSDINNKEGACVDTEKIQWSNTKADSLGETVTELFGREIGSYTCDIVVDPFRPLCMYELRGKCNNDECPWQHVRDNSNAIMSHDQSGDSDSDGMQIPFFGTSIVFMSVVF